MATLRNGSDQQERSPEGPSNQTVSVGTVSVNASPGGFHFYARCFLAAANQVPVQERFSPVPYYLVCHSIELFLKSFLSAEGYQLKRLKSRKFGHDLEKILSAASTEGVSELVPIKPRDEEQIQLGDAHYSNDKGFEYFQLVPRMTGNPPLPDLPISRI